MPLRRARARRPRPGPSAAHEAAADRHAQAQRVAGDVRPADQRLTSAAQMVVATGARRWVDDYDAHLPELDDALARAKALAMPAAARRFDQLTRVANEELASMRESAFEAATTRSRPTGPSCARCTCARKAPRSSMP